MDDEPDELFPLQPTQMMYSYCDDVPSAVEFLTRYQSFWNGCNILLYDRQKRSVAIEKCSANFMDVFYPGSDGRSHISGMVCRNPGSAAPASTNAHDAGGVTSMLSTSRGTAQTICIGKLAISLRKNLRRN